MLLTAQRGCSLEFVYRKMRKICKTCLMTGEDEFREESRWHFKCSNSVFLPSEASQSSTDAHAHAHAHTRRAAFLFPLTAAVGQCSLPLTIWHSCIPNASTIHLNSQVAALNYLCLHTRGMQVQGGVCTHKRAYSAGRKQFECSGGVVAETQMGGEMTVFD